MNVKLFIKLHALVFIVVMGAVALIVSSSSFFNDFLKIIGLVYFLSLAFFLFGAWVVTGENIFTSDKSLDKFYRKILSLIFLLIKYIKTIFHKVIP